MLQLQDVVWLYESATPPVFPARQSKLENAGFIAKRHNKSDPAMLIPFCSGTLSFAFCEGRALILLLCHWVPPVTLGVLRSEAL